MKNIVSVVADLADACTNSGVRRLIVAGVVALSAILLNKTVDGATLDATINTVAAALVAILVHKSDQ